MDKKINLEHTIRNIMNKSDTNASKVGLEHTIRNVMTESIGGTNTDKFKGTQKAFLQPAPLIEPKVGDSHPDGASVTAKRGAAKIKQSETMKEEEQLDEFLKPLATGVGLAVKHGDEVIDLLGDILKTTPKPNKLPAVKPTKTPGKLPFKEPTPQKPIELPPTAPANVPAVIPKKVPETPPTKAPEKLPTVTPGKPPAVSPAPSKVDIPQKLPSVKTPSTVPATAPSTIPKIGTSVATKLGAAGALATSLGTAIATKLKPKEKGGTPPPSGRPPRPTSRDGGLIPPPFGLPGDTGFTAGGSGSTIDVGTYVHRAGKRAPDRFSEEINLQDAEEIKRKTRKAQIIRKIIDEQKKKKETSTVILNPKLKDQEVDKN